MVGVAELEIGDPAGPDDDAFTATAAEQDSAAVAAPESAQSHVSFQLPGDSDASGSTEADLDDSAVNPVVQPAGQPAGCTTTASHADAGAFTGPESDNTLYEEEMLRHSIALADTLQAKRAQGAGRRPDDAVVAPVALLDDLKRRQLWPQLLRPTQVSYWVGQHLFAHPTWNALPHTLRSPCRKLRL